jgi:hypothetical protein
MRKTILLFLVFGFLVYCGSNAFAGLLPGGMKGTLEIKHEDDRLDDDRTVVKSKLTLKKELKVIGTTVTPYAHYEDESYEGILSSANRKETETAVGLNVVALKNDMIKITLGTVWEYEDNASGDDDGLLIFKFKADF